MAFNGNSKCWMYPMIEIISAPDETKPWLKIRQTMWCHLLIFAYHLNSPGANIHLGLTLYAKICCIGIACCQTLWIMTMHQTLVCQAREGGLLTILKPLGIYSIWLTLNLFLWLEKRSFVYTSVEVCSWCQCKGLSKGHVLWQLDNSSIINSTGTNHKKNVYPLVN